MYLIFVALLFLAIVACEKINSSASKEKRRKSIGLVIQGINKSEIRDWPAAEARFNEAIKVDPTNAEAYFERGKYKRMGKGRYQNNYDHSGALEDFNKAIELDSNYIEAYLLRAQVRGSWKKDYNGALEDYTKASQLDPNNAEIYIEIGDHKWLYEDNYREAIDYYTESITIDPNKGNSYTKRSRMWLELNEKDKFCQDYLMALRLADHEAQEFLKRKDYADWVKDCK